MTPEFGEPETLWRTPVIAWLIEAYLIRKPLNETYATTIAITCSGSVEDTPYYALQYGDGPPFFTVNETFDNEASLWAYFHDEERRRLALRKQRP